MLYKTYDSTQMCHICPRTPGKTKKKKPNKQKHHIKLNKMNLDQTEGTPLWEN